MFLFLFKDILRKKALKFFLAVLLFMITGLSFLFAPVAALYCDINYPDYASFVNDYTGTLDTGWINTIENVCSRTEAETGAEVAVAIVSSLEGITIEEYAVKLFEKWGIGKAAEGNGVLLLISISDRKLRIEVGYGLEGVITDIEAGNIINNIIVPRFKDGDYNTGVYQGVVAIAEEIYAQQGKTLETTVPVSEAKTSNFFDSPTFSGLWRNPLLICCFPIFFIVTIVSVIKSILRKKCPKCKKIKLRIKTTIIQQATYTTTGKMLEERDCTYIYPTGIACGYHDQRTVTIPKKTRSSGGGFFGGSGGFSGGGGGGGFGGFGGGSSGGGGASGGW